MADKSIFELNLQTTFAPNDRLVVGNYANSDAEAITGQQLIALLAVALDGHGGIANIAKTSSSGTNPVIDVYTVTYADATTTSFTVTNGLKGDTGAQTYVWLRWAHTEPTRWSDTTSTPDDWMGIYTGLSSTQPTSVSSYAWYEVKGEKGDTGDAASIVSTAVEYQTSTSGTVIPTGTWTTTVPTVPQGGYLWTRTTLAFNSGSPIISYAVSYAGIDGQGSPSSATPQMDNGNGSAGTGTAFSRDDHIHPTDTTRQAVLVSGTNIKTVGGTTLLGSGNIPFPVTSVNGESGAVVLDPDDVGAMSKWELLWENASPSSSFGQQTVSVPTISNYDWVAIEYHASAPAIFMRTDRDGVTFMSMAPGWKSYPTYRTATLHTSGNTIGIEFSTAYVQSGNSQDANEQKPVRIFGIKGLVTT